MSAMFTVYFSYITHQVHIGQKIKNFPQSKQIVHKLNDGDDETLLNFFSVVFFQEV